MGEVGASQPIRRVYLTNTIGTHRKFYEIAVWRVAGTGHFDVNVRYGRIGSSGVASVLQGSVSNQRAVESYETRLKAKLDKGYKIQTTKGFLPQYVGQPNEPSATHVIVDTLRTLGLTNDDIVRAVVQAKNEKNNKLADRTLSKSRRRGAGRSKSKKSTKHTPPKRAFDL